MRRGPTTPKAAAVALFAVLFAVPLVGANQYYVYTCNIVLIYIILTVGLNLVMGFAGQLVLANAAIFGIGAYGVGLLQKHFMMPFWLGLPAGALIASAIGLVLVLPALRLSGIYLALATLAFAQCALWLMGHWTAVTFGAGGFTIPPVSFAPLPIGSDTGMYYLSWASCVLLLWAARNIVRSRIGRSFVAIRDHEISAQALGIDLLRFKAIAFALSSFYAGMAGALFAGTLQFVGPESFDLRQMILQLVAVVLGGIASLPGSVIGGAMIVVILELTKALKVSVEMVFGALLLGFVLVSPGGIVDVLRKRLPSWGEKLHGESARSAPKSGSDAAEGPP
ncbi:MAG TPA: branched-chain amino acid ABC transporter permease [Steroidobacteraceae bacterium]|jgi:branched-chain amino acid transport system permease protein